MEDYIVVDDRIQGRRVLYDDRITGIVTEKVSEGNAKRGAEYAVRLDSGQNVYITDRSLGKFKMIRS